MKVKQLNAVFLTAAMVATGAYAAGCAGDTPDALDVPYDYSSGSGDGGNGQGGSSSSGTNTQDAQEFYETQVHADLVSECASCHGMDQTIGPAWLETEASAAYATLNAYPGLVNAPDCSTIMTKSKGEHAGPSLTAGLETRVVEWLQLEAAQNGFSCGGGGGPEGGALEQCNAALEEFASCMSYAHWEVSGAYDVANQGTEGGPCYSCHEAGTGGAKLSIDPLATFNAHKDDEYFLIKIVRCAISNGEFQGLQAALRYDNKGIEPCTSQSGNCHPSYVLTPERSDDLQAFIDDTINAVENGTCEQLDEQAQNELNNQ